MNDIPGLLPITPEGGKVARAAAVVIEAATSSYLTHSLHPG
jgi:hypothetical protein